MTAHEEAARKGRGVTGEVDIEAFVKAAKRSRLDELYEEVMAAKRTGPQVLVRRGIGEVLRVR